MRFEIQAECPVTRARAGFIHTDHGSFRRRSSCRSGTQATVKGVTPQQLLDEVDPPIILSNTYHLYLRPGHETVRALGGLHRFMDWPRAILTDSGGFQVFSLDSLRKISEDGVLFQSHLDGSPHMFTPESTVDVQLALGSDICMVLDECLGYPATREAAKVSMDRTIRWAKRGRSALAGANAVDRVAAMRCSRSFRAECTRICGAECARELVELDAPGYAIGGLSVGEPRELSQEMTEVTAPLLPREKPRYVMGVGMPDELPEYVSRGVDMMDCVLPSRNARNGYLFTSEGRVIIKHAQYKEDHRPGGSGLRLLHLPAIQPGLPAASVSGGRDSVQYACRRSTTCAGTLTSCGKCERLFYPGHSPNILVRRASRRASEASSLTSS